MDQLEVWSSYQSFAARLGLDEVRHLESRLVDESLSERQKEWRGLGLRILIENHSIDAAFRVLKRWLNTDLGIPAQNFKNIRHARAALTANPNSELIDRIRPDVLKLLEMTPTEFNLRYAEPNKRVHLWDGGHPSDQLLQMIGQLHVEKGPPIWRRCWQFLVFGLRAQ